MRLLIIGGTRQIGHSLALRLLESGHSLTLLNRGLTPDHLPASIPRLRADRSDSDALRQALRGQDFDVVIDNVLYKEAEASAAVDLFSGRVGHYIVMSTGQVYLVRAGLTPPFREVDYAGPLMAPPPPVTYDYEEYTYGLDKRRAEDALHRAWDTDGFPYTTLRLPMVTSERDPFNRLYAYLLRIKDGGPLLVPQDSDIPVRHVDVQDVVTAVTTLIDAGPAAHAGRAYNISQGESLSIDTFIATLGELLDLTPRIERVERGLLEANGFLPDCSPFSDRWMSVLDNALSTQALGLTYTPVRETLARVVAHYEVHPPPPPASYRRRSAEKHLV